MNKANNIKSILESGLAAVSINNHIMLTVQRPSFSEGKAKILTK